MNKGFHHSEESKRKISFGLKGKSKHPFSAEHRKHLSESHRGVKFSAERKRHLSDGQKGRIGYWKGKHLSEVHKKRISEGNKGKKLSKECIEKLKQNHGFLGGRHSDEAKKKISEAGKGRCHSENSKKKMSETKKRKFASGETIPTNIGLKFSEEHKAKISNALKGKRNGSWMGGIAHLPYTKEFDNELRELIRYRDNYRCQLCGMPEAENLMKLSVHHIDYDKQNYLPSNLISLCKGCHSKTNANRFEWQKYFSINIKEKRKKVRLIAV